MNTSTKPQHEITTNPMDGTAGFICRTHGVHLYGHTYAEAERQQAQHVRVFHPGPMAAILANLTLDLTAMAVRVGAAYSIQEVTGQEFHPPILDAWEAMTGLSGEQASDLATHIVGHHDHVTAAVVPL
jgi:hypothetical protein